MTDLKQSIRTIIVLAGCTIASVAWTAEPGNDEGITKADVAKAFKPEFSPYAGRNYPTRVLWGIHICTLRYRWTPVR
jgi:hypothetical protein